MKPTLSILACTLLISPVANGGEEPSLVQIQRLTLGTALTVAQAAIDACTEKGIQVGVTVVDRDGNVQVAVRDTIAAPITLSISKGQAFKAANFNNATGAMPQLANMAIGRVPGVVMTDGGLPIQVAGTLVGAVGVSGAPSGKTDEACAQAGIDAVLDDLEMGL